MHLSIATKHRASPLQVGLLFEGLASPGEGLYVQQVIIRPPGGALDAAALRMAWDRVVSRHDALRTAFVIRGEDPPSQLVHRRIDGGVCEHDWRSFSESESKEAWRELVERDRTRGFAPEEAPLWRLAICRLGESEHRLLWSYHHALLDGRSRLLLLEELLGLYASYCNGPPVELSEPEPLAPLFAWLDDGSGIDDCVAFWREVLAGRTAPTPLPERGALPGDGPEPRSGKSILRFSEEISDGIRGLARGHSVTTATVFQAAWALLLAQEAREDDVVFGVTRAGRASLPFDATRMVGLLMTTVPSRARIREGMALGEWLGELRAEALAVRPFEHCSLVDIQQATDVPAQLPLFESLFVFERGTMNTLLPWAESGWDFEMIERLGYPLGVNVYDGAEIVVNVLVDGTRVDLETARRLLRRYEQVLREFVDRPDGPVAEFGLLTDDGRQRLAPAQGRAARGRDDRTVVDRFEQQVQTTPRAPALRSGAGAISYAELNAGANRIAHRLRALGVGPDVLVAVMLERSPTAVMAILGVLKAGGAYVPVDPAYPAARVAFMLEDTEAAVLVTQKQLLEEHAAGARVVLCLDDALAAVASESARDSDHRPGSGDLAYVLYTSGSTGRPKGVAIEHRSAAALVDWAAGEFSAGELERVLASTSFSFDLSVFELFAPLCTGGTVILVDDPLTLLEASPDVEPTLVNTAPSVMTELLRHGSLPATVTTVNLAGEALVRDLVDRLYGESGVRRVLNLYGPTEDTTYSTGAECAAGAGVAPHIGRPFPGGEAHVLDAREREVAIGVTGELYLGGVGLARGYLNRPDLTAERFRDIPIGGLPPRRLYRTGDLARWQADGNLAWGGRTDAQVKVRGLRIEPGEVEATLTDHPNVSAAAVVAERHDGDRRLVAYVVGPSADPADVRRHLRATLPAHMVPALIVPLDSLPITANGKLDTRALPAPDVRVRPGRALNETERAIAELWLEVLGLTKLPQAEDDFFELGGHSFLALRLFAQIEERFGRRPPLAVLFRSPTVAGLARELETAAEASTGSLVPVQPDGSRPPWFGVMTDLRGVLALRGFRAGLGPAQPIYGIEAIQLGPDGRKEPSIDTIAARCLVAVRERQDRGPYFLGGHSLGGVVAYAMACQLEAAGERVAFLALLDTVAPGTSSPGSVRVRWRERRYELRHLDSHARAALLVRLAFRVGRRTLGSVWRAPNAGPLPSPRGFDDPYDIEHVERLLLGYRPAALRAPLLVLSTRESSVRAGRATLGWERIAAAPVEAVVVPGAHVSVLAPPNVDALSVALARRLDAARDVV